MLKGDIYPDLVTPLADVLAIPLTDIYNSSRTYHDWPKVWKEETMVIIPKCNTPNSYSDLRNLSCTPFVETVTCRFLA